ncbi:unnamed protein product [Pieris brassicae]|uniref:Uncharacterized protein n=1 Tax=Pieris brassicae TaxID=7116 RepID=A0A9P0SUM3_PIEBR|nr:unnamed protein product [Pieris brassicae]
MNRFKNGDFMFEARRGSRLINKFSDPRVFCKLTHVCELFLCISCFIPVLLWLLRVQIVSALKCLKQKDFNVKKREDVY